MRSCAGAASDPSVDHLEGEPDSAWHLSLDYIFEIVDAKLAFLLSCTV